MAQRSFDYIVIGAGSAGCVLANRLSADPAISVLLLEAGGRTTSWKTRMPAALALPLQDERLNWGYQTEPQPGLGNRVIHWPRGRGLGGSSAINGMVYVRGHALDYERWQGEGAAGWGWADVLPYFKKAQRHQAGAGPYRGGDGPLAVSRANTSPELNAAWLAAGAQAGYGVSPDLNGDRQEGFGYLDMTVGDGERCSADRAYLAPVRHRPNLKIVSSALVHRVVIEKERATAVEYSAGGTIAIAYTRGEIIISAGAINSPQLLQLSGIGDPTVLAAAGVKVRRHLPAVGRNLQDHLCVYVQYECQKPVSLAAVLGPIGKLRIGAEWLLSRRGIGASNQFEVGAFLRGAADAAHPDIQYHFLPLAIGYEILDKLPSHSFQVDADGLRPKSTGSVTIVSADPRRHPRIDPNYLAADEDLAVLRRGIRQAREIFAQPAFAELRGVELAPGAACDTDADLDDYIRRTAQSAYHPSCTCRMGLDEQAVVDPACQVRGVDGLRVVDASVMPSIVSGNLNAPTIMVAERVADLILGRPVLPPDPVATPMPPTGRPIERQMSHA